MGDGATVRTCRGQHIFQIADYCLIAHALSGGYVVATNEVPSDSVRKIKIPNVCIGMQVKCISQVQMLRMEKARFVLGQD